MRQVMEILIFNFHITNSVPDYEFIVPEPGDYKIILNTDNTAFGGHGRIDESIVFITHYSKDDHLHRLKIYNTNRTAVVLEKIK